jgi:hypothetical protein
MKTTLPYSRQKSERGDIVYFLGDDISVKKAWININDPFLEQMQVFVLSNDADTPDTNEETTYVPYSELRPQPQSIQAPPSQESDEEIQEPVLRVQPKKRTPHADVPAIEDALSDILNQCDGTYS